MHGTTFRALTVTSQVETPGAESAVYDCLVILCNDDSFNFDDSVNHVRYTPSVA